MEDSSFAHPLEFTSGANVFFFFVIKDFSNYVQPHIHLLITERLKGF